MSNQERRLAYNHAAIPNCQLLIAPKFGGNISNAPSWSVKDLPIWAQSSGQVPNGPRELFVICARFLPQPKHHQKVPFGGSCHSISHELISPKNDWFVPPFSLEKSQIIAFFVALSSYQTPYASLLVYI